MKRNVKRIKSRRPAHARARRHPGSGRIAVAARAGSAPVLASRQAEGFHQGFDQGYNWGRSSAIIAHAPPLVDKIWEIRVLFIMSGKGVPYSPIDQAVYEALMGTVRECFTTLPNGPVLELVDQLQPNLVLVLEGMELPPAIVDLIRQRGIRTAVWFTDDPYYVDVTEKLAPHYDDVFTLELNCVDFYRSIGCQRVHYLPLGANPAVFRPQPVPEQFRKDVSFIGSAYWNRVAFVGQLVPLLARTNSLVSGWWWERLPQFRHLQGRIQSGVWLSPEDTAKYYYGSRIVLNVHRAHDDESYNCNKRKIEAFSVNPRTFEIAASGAFQMTDERSDLLNYYTPGVEVITYQTPADCMEKVRYYLTHEDERREIAFRSLHRTLREHTYHKRIHLMLATLFPE